MSYSIENIVGMPEDYSDKDNWLPLPDVDTFFVYPNPEIRRK